MCILGIGDTDLILFEMEVFVGKLILKYHSLDFKLSVR